MYIRASVQSTIIIELEITTERTQSILNVLAAPFYENNRGLN